MSCRDKAGKDTVLAVDCIANISLDPALLLIGIMPIRNSHHIIKETRCFVVNYPKKCMKRAYEYIGTVSGRDEDKLKILGIKTENAKFVNAPILLDCPVSIECSVIESYMPGTHELFVAKIEAVHCEEEYLDKCGKIMWSKIKLL